MKSEKFRAAFNDYPIFSLEEGVTVSGIERASFSKRMVRWQKEGIIIPLKRGLFAFPDKLRQVVAADIWLASRLYQPSYVSCEMALHRHNMIAEMVFAVTCVTTRHTSAISNQVGRYYYRTVKPELFWGYEAIEPQERPHFVAKHGPIFMARPEKALLDYFWMRPKVEWCAEKLEAELRLRFSEKFSVHRFRSYAKRFHSPRILRAADVALEVMQAEKASWEEVPEQLEEESTTAMQGVSP